MVPTFQDCINKIKLDDSYTTIFINANDTNANVSTLKSLMTNHQNITNRIIAISSNALPGVRSKCISQGYDFYITKPYNEYELDDIIKNI